MALSFIEDGFDDTGSRLRSVYRCTIAEISGERLGVIQMGVREDDGSKIFVVSEQVVDVDVLASVDENTRGLALAALVLEAKEERLVAGVWTRVLIVDVRAFVSPVPAARSSSFSLTSVYAVETLGASGISLVIA